MNTLIESPEDKAFSPTNGILLADISRGVPIVSLKERLNQWLGFSLVLSASYKPLIKEKRTVLRGYPYSTCHTDDVNESGLDFFDNYTKNQCRQECMTKVIERECHCWPNSIGIAQRNITGKLVQ